MRAKRQRSVLAQYALAGRWRLLAAFAAMAAARVAWLLLTGFDRTLLDAAQFQPLLLGRFGIYQAALAILIGSCMITYAVIWRVCAAETLASVSGSGDWRVFGAAVLFSSTTPTM